MEIKTVKMTDNGIDMTVDRNEFALALKTWRLRNGYTQKKAGELLGTSRYTIIRAESGRPITWESAYRIFAKLSHYLRKEVENEQF